MGGGGEIVKWWAVCLTGGEERFHSREKGEGKWVGGRYSRVVGAVSD